MALERVLIDLFSAYYPLLAFMAGLLAGDIMMFLGILAGAGKANFFLLILFGFIGGVLHDILFYIISNSKLMNFIKRVFRLPKKRNRIARFIEGIGNDHYFWPVFMAKFVYGVRDVVILYVAHNHKSFKKYLLIVSIADLIWILVITSAGWVAGKGFTSMLRIFKGLEKWLFISLAGIILIYLVNKFIVYFFSKKI